MLSYFIEEEFLLAFDIFMSDSQINFEPLAWPTCEPLPSPPFHRRFVGVLIVVLGTFECKEK